MSERSIDPIYQVPGIVVEDARIAYVMYKIQHNNSIVLRESDFIAGYARGYQNALMRVNHYGEDLESVSA